MATTNTRDSQYARSLIEASLDPLVTISAEGKITDVNEASIKVTGVPRKKLIGTDFSNYFTDPKKAQNGYLKVFEKGFVSDYPLTIKHKNGNLTDVLYNASVYKDNKGKVLGVFAAARDVTEQTWAKEIRLVNKELLFQYEEKGKRADELSIANKELLFQNEEKEKRAAELLVAHKVISDYKYALDEFSIVAITDLNGKITHANDNFCKISKYSREELIGKDHRIVNSRHHSKEFIKKLWATITSGKVWKGEIKNKAKDGKYYWVDTTIIPFLDDNGKPYQYTAIRNDITFQKEIQEKLTFQNEEKEKGAEELGIANKELLFQNKEKEKRAAELIIANKELAFQNKEKEKRAAELIVANKELAFQNKEKEKRADELLIANKELIFQNQEKEKRAAELIIANKELIFQNQEKGKRAEELVIADIELVFQNKEKKKRAIANKELKAIGYSLKLASQYSRSLIEASRDPLITINIEGKITDMNEAWTRITEMSRKKLKGTDFFDYFTEPKKAREGYKEVFKKGFVVDFPLTVIDGELTDVLFNGSVYKDEKGNVLGAVVVARDITEQKKIAKELIEAKVFAELATSIAEEAKINAENALKAKQQFLSNMSHEIRTPMNAIIGFTKVILKTDLTVKQREYLSAIKVSGNALIVLINDILDLAKVDAGKMVFEKSPFKMASSIAAMLHLFEIKTQEKNLLLIKEYDNEIPDVLLGDSVRLHQIILNLISNAVKFTTKGKITVSIKLLLEDEEKVTIKFSVSDTGIGIADDKINQIFDNFQQASNDTSRLYGGTGLGLAIVKQLVQPQGGTISVKSKVNEGTTFSFCLSFDKTNEEAELDIEYIELDKEIKKIKVLVVEDIPLNQLLMKTLLDDFGFQRDIAANGKVAIEKLQHKSYDIILMDLQMPEMNGFEATTYIRNTMHSEIPIIALTADVTTADLKKCTEVGMNDYISKPVDERILYSKIVNLATKPTLVNPKKLDDNKEKIERIKRINLTYLDQRTKSNADLMMEMISLYLEQTPPLIALLKKSFLDKDWVSLGAAAHKMIPSFSIVGIDVNFENMARKIQEYAAAQQEDDEITELVLQLENVCTQACEELMEELNTIKKMKR